MFGARAKKLISKSCIGNILILNSRRGCTDFIIAGGSGSSSYAIQSRTMEFGGMLTTDNMEVQQKGKLFNYGGLEKKNDYGYMVVNATLSDGNTSAASSCDGFNEFGLSCDLLYFPRSIGWPEQNDFTVDKNICCEMIVPFILGNCRSLQDVRDALQNEYYVWGNEFHNEVWKSHYHICDIDGNGLVVEYENGECNIYDSIGVMTNEPRYSYHLENVHKYCHLTNFVSREVQSEQFGHGAGLIGLPGDLTPPSRFVRAYLSKKFLEKEDVIKNNESAIIESHHIINSVDIVRGMAKGYVGENDDDVELDYTMWSSMKDLVNKKVYFRHYDALNWEVYDFGKELSKLQDGQSSILAQFDVEQRKQGQIFKKIKNVLKMAN